MSLKLYAVTHLTSKLLERIMVLERSLPPEYHRATEKEIRHVFSHPKAICFVLANGAQEIIAYVSSLPMSDLLDNYFVNDSNLKRDPTALYLDGLVIDLGHFSLENYDLMMHTLMRNARKKEFKKIGLHEPSGKVSMIFQDRYLANFERSLATWGDLNVSYDYLEIDLELHGGHASGAPIPLTPHPPTDVISTKAEPNI